MHILFNLAFQIFRMKKLLAYTALVSIAFFQCVVLSAERNDPGKLMRAQQSQAIGRYHKLFTKWDTRMNDFRMRSEQDYRITPSSLGMNASDNNIWIGKIKCPRKEGDTGYFKVIGKSLNFFELPIQLRGVGMLLNKIGLTSLCDAKKTINKDQGILLVANKHSNTLSFINLKTFKVIQTIPTGPNPHEIIVTPDQRFAYLSSYEAPGNTISVIDLLKRKQIKQINTGKYSRIHGAAMALDGKNAYFTAGQTGFVVEIDTKTNEVTRAIPTQGKISHMVYVSPDDKYLYTSNIVSENVSVIDRVTGKLITQIPCGPGCEGMAFTPDGKYLWVANQTAGTITVIDLASYKPIETFECKGMPVRIRFTANGKLALVPGWVKEGTLTVIDVATRKEIKRIRVGDYAIGVELTPDEKFAFVGCEDSMEAQVLPDGTEKIKVNEGDSDGIHVIDMKSLSVITVIKSGLGPDPMVIWHPPAN
jgi:YVTN family beta-propeller protein